MSFTMKYKEITSAEFTHALQFLTTQTMGIKTAYAVKKLVDDVQKARKVIGAEFHDTIIAKYAKKKEDGTYEYAKDENGVEDKNAYMPDPAQKEAMDAACAEFDVKMATIDRDKIPLQNIAHIQISVSHLAFLDPILEDMEEHVAEVTKIGKAKKA